MIFTDNIYEDNKQDIQNPSQETLNISHEDFKKLQDLVKVVHSQYLHKDYFENKLLSIYEKELGYKKITNVQSIAFLLFSILIQIILLLLVFNVTKELILPESMLYYGLPAITKSTPEISDAQDFNSILEAHSKNAFSSFKALSTILSNIKQSINNNMDLKHLCLEGISGIGKTSFMQTLIHYLLKIAPTKSCNLGYLPLTSDHFIKVPNKTKQLLKYFKDCEKLLKRKVYDKIIISLDEIDEYIDYGFDMTYLEIPNLTFYTTSNNRPKNSAQMASRMNIIRFDIPLPSYFESVMNALFKNNEIKLNNDTLKIKDVTTLEKDTNITKTYDLFNLLVMIQSDMRQSKNIDKFAQFAKDLPTKTSLVEKNNLKISTVEKIIMDQITTIKASIISKQKIIKQFEENAIINEYVSNKSLPLEKIKNIFKSNIDIQEQAVNISKQFNLIIYDLQKLVFFQLLMSNEFSLNNNIFTINDFLNNLDERRNIINNLSIGLAHKILDRKTNNNLLDITSTSNILNSDFKFPTNKSVIFEYYGDLYNAILDIESSEFASSLSDAALEALQIKQLQII